MSSYLLEVVELLDGLDVLAGFYEFFDFFLNIQSLIFAYKSEDY